MATRASMYQYFGLCRSPERGEVWPRTESYRHGLIVVSRKSVLGTEASHYFLHVI
jgi:hypothetical protein